MSTDEKRLAVLKQMVDEAQLKVHVGLAKFKSGQITQPEMRALHYELDAAESAYHKHVFPGQPDFCLVTSSPEKKSGGFWANL